MHHPAAVRAWTSAIIACVNLLYYGPREVKASPFLPSAAQTRVHSVLVKRVSDFVGEIGSWPTQSEIQNYFNLSEGYATSGGNAVPLGELGGVPPSAADVDTAGVLDTYNPQLAAQVREPSLLLLPPRERPLTLRRPCRLLHTSYPKLVRTNVRVGLQKLMPRRSIWKHHGRPVIGGSFGIQKNGRRASSDFRSARE